MTPPLAFRTPLTLVWREPGLLQVGLDPGRSVLLPQSPPEADRALAEVGAGRRVADVGKLHGPAVAAWLERATASLLAAGLVEPRRVPPLELTVVGTGPLADACAHLADASRTFRVHRTPPDLPAAGPAGTPVLVATDRIEPDRALLGTLVAARRPHLVVRAEPERVVVGPFVVVGDTACVRCLDLLRRDLDPRWPHLLAQLCRSRSVPDAAATAWAAATAVVQLGAWGAGSVPESGNTTVELDGATHRAEYRSWRRHPGCGCSLAGLPAPRAALRTGGGRSQS